MKVAKLSNTTSINHVANLSNAVGTGYFDLLLDHYSLEIFNTESNAEHSLAALLRTRIERRKCICKAVFTVDKFF